jgi:hypothetical protein
MSLQKSYLIQTQFACAGQPSLRREAADHDDLSADRTWCRKLDIDTRSVFNNPWPPRGQCSTSPEIAELD